MAGALKVRGDDADGSRMRRHGRSWLVLATWLVITSRDPSVPVDEWKVVERAPTANACDHARDALAHEATTRELGALSYTDVQNAVRVAAYEKAYRRVSLRYRCVEE
jgi:hypothetical protein